MEANAEDIIQGGLTISTVLRTLFVTTLMCLTISANLFFLYEMGVADNTVIESHGHEQLYEGEDAPGDFTIHMHELTNHEQEFLKSNEKRVITPDERSNYPNLVTKYDNIRTENGYYTHRVVTKNLFEWVYYFLGLPLLTLIGSSLRSKVMMGSSILTLAITIPYGAFLIIVGCPI